MIFFNRKTTSVFFLVAAVISAVSFSVPKKADAQFFPFGGGNDRGGGFPNPLNILDPFNFTGWRDDDRDRGNNISSNNYNSYNNYNNYYGNRGRYNEVPLYQGPTYRRDYRDRDDRDRRPIETPAPRPRPRPTPTHIPDPYPYEYPVPQPYPQPYPVPQPYSQPYPVPQPYPQYYPQPQPIYVPQPQPIYISQPQPVVISQPRPIVVTQPQPVIIANAPIYKSFVTCSPDVTTVSNNRFVTWTANVSGGKAPYQFSWTGTEYSNSAVTNSNSVYVYYSTYGQKYMAVNVKSADGLYGSASCGPVNIVDP